MGRSYDIFKLNFNLGKTDKLLGYYIMKVELGVDLCKVGVSE
jgi:hypothetical protein